MSVAQWEQAQELHTLRERVFKLENENARLKSNLDSLQRKFDGACAYVGTGRDGLGPFLERWAHQ